MITKDNKDRCGADGSLKRNFADDIPPIGWNIIENTWREDGPFLLHRISINIGAASAIQ